MSLKCDIYIGSENGSRKLSHDYIGKVVEWANENFPEGYTLVTGKGFYNGSTEDSIILSVLSDGSSGAYHGPNFRKSVNGLKTSLGQESILLSKHPVRLVSY